MLASKSLAVRTFTYSQRWPTADHDGGRIRWSIRFLWASVYRRWLWCSFSKKYYCVIRVKGWRTAIVQNPCAHRSTMSPCFLWFD